MLRYLLAVITTLALLVPRIVRADESEPAPQEHWYVVQMQGQRCGHMHAQTRKEADRFISSSEMRLEIKRGQVSIPITIATEFIETDDFKPVRMKSVTKLGALPTTTEYLFKPDGVEVKTSTAGSLRTEKASSPEGRWLTPMAMEREIARRIAEGAKEIAVRSVEPSAGLKAATTTMTLLERAPLEVVGKTVPALKWSSRNELVPNVTSTEFTDERGIPLRSETSIGGIQIILIRADKALALSKANPPELLESTFIRPDKQIKNARTSRRGTFLVSSGDAPIGTWPGAGIQSATLVDAHSVRIATDVDRTSACSKEDIASDDFRKPSAMINSDDAKVRELTDRVNAKLDRADAAARANAMREFVHDYITRKTFDVGFASAAETAQTRTGDCSEHAVLLCAMLRAGGIPARCVSGLVYADGIGKDGSGAMGYHMWAQAMVPDAAAAESGAMKWIDLDAALSREQRTDATHLAIRTLALSNGQTMNDLMDILPTLGKLKVVVEKVE